MLELKSLEDLFEHLLQDMYYAENRISKTLPEMAEKATSEKLTKGFEQHLKETKDQISKLEKVFDMTGLKQKREKCDAIEGLLKEGEHLIKDAQKGDVRDAALIAAAQKVEHYEIASYGMMCMMAKKLGHNEAAGVLGEILQQEKDTDTKLVDLARNIDEKAMKQAA